MTSDLKRKHFHPTLLQGGGGRGGCMPVVLHTSEHTRKRQVVPTILATIVFVLF